MGPWEGLISASGKGIACFPKWDPLSPGPQAPPRHPCRESLSREPEGFAVLTAHLFSSEATQAPVPSPQRPEAKTPAVWVSQTQTLSP